MAAVGCVFGTYLERNDTSAFEFIMERHWEKMKADTSVDKPDTEIVIPFDNVAIFAKIFD